jgi:hypothetical protein
VIRPSHVIFGVLLGATDIHPAGQTVTLGGEEWVQVGNQAFFRSPDIVIPRGPVVTAPSHTETCVNRKGVALTLRKDAWRIEHNSSQTSDNSVAESLTRTLERLNNKTKDPGHDCRNN